jgi:hypothetical protein
VFRLSTTGTFTVLDTFNGGPDGGSPSETCSETPQATFTALPPCLRVRVTELDLKSLARQGAYS